MGKLIAEGDAELTCVDSLIHRRWRVMIRPSGRFYLGATPDAWLTAMLRLLLFNLSNRSEKKFIRDAGVCEGIP